VILEWLLSGRSLTAVEALNRFGCFRLAARIENLRADGHAIQTQMVSVNDAKIACYSLPTL
jgi:hypothetical protein